MAGQKLSARQKMINMMYLVLTALLALNVSAEILDAFESMRKSLETSTSTYTLKNEQTVQSIREAIKKEDSTGNKSNLYLLQVVEDITSQADQAMNFLSQLTSGLEEIGGKDPSTGEVLKKDVVDANYWFWMGNQDMANGGRGNGKAMELNDKLGSFVDWGNMVWDTLYTKIDSAGEKNHFATMTLEPGDDPRITNADSKGKSWEYHTFHGKPVIADLAMVEKFKMEVKERESEMLGLVERLFTGAIYKIDKLVAMEAPSAQVVAAGMKFETKLMVGLYSENVRPDFLGSGISRDPGGHTATMSLTANGSVIPKGKNEGIQKYRATIKVPKANGEFELLPIEGQFIVRKPEVVVRSRELQLVYKDCGNNVTVDVPALGDSYNPDFSRSKGGKVIKSSKNRKDITIVPTSRNFFLSVHSNTNGQNVKIDELKYNVVKPPKPRMALFVDGKEHNGRSPISKRQKVTVKIIPDPEFQRTLPRDARYKVSKVKLLVQEGLGGAKTVASGTGNVMTGIKMDLYKGAIRSAPSGSRIYFEIEEVNRVNFQNKRVKVDMSRVELLKPAVLK